ncbi:glycosyltransferase [Georgenia sp. MJ173]|uniref:glycosyltransferase n=1 Tax=Georgenia sunbinii TaxID=3117728 RepID=UPI002F263B79
MARTILLVLSFSVVERDPRVLRQIRLFRDDYDVITCGFGPSPAGVADHIQVPDELRSWRPSFKPVALMLEARLHHRLYFGAARTRFVRSEIARRGGVDIILANDVLAVPLALALHARRGVHADLHEFAPGQEVTGTWVRRVKPFMQWACRTSLSRVASITTVSPGIAEEYRKQFGVDADVVPNATRYRDDLEPRPTSEPIRVIHAGAAGRVRRLEVMIDAVARVNARTPGRFELDLYLVPGDDRYIRELAERAGDTAVTGVAVREPVSFTELVPTMHRYDVGLFICPPTTINLKHALPNKVFEFVQARLALVVSPSPAMASLVREHGVGVVTDGFEAAGLVRVLDALAPADVEAYKAASHAAAEILSAEVLSAPWLDAISALDRSGTTSS